MRLGSVLSTLALSSRLCWARTGPLVRRDEAPAESDDGLDPPKGTQFNGQEVPPMTVLTADTVTEEVSKGNWLVEFFSPWCHHCQHFAPTWQTLYEFYYTSNPVQGTKSEDSTGLNSFTRYYNFKFAKLDCVAFGSACEKFGVHSFPTVLYLKDGKEVKKNTGAKEMPEISKFVEEILESIRPGSRPKEGLKLPKAGDHEVDTKAEPEQKEAKDKDPAAGAAAGEKHNSIANEEAKATAASSANLAKPTVDAAPAKISKNSPNPDGKSIKLTAEDFQRLVTTTRDPWFVKFYAPWCGHCQAMAPNWAGMAREMRGILNIGEVNCEKEKWLCKDAKVKGFPTMLFFRGGERVEYNGLRGVGDLITFASKAIDVGLGVEDVDFDSFKEMEETEEVIFLYFYDHATTSEDFAALERLTLSLIGHGKLVKTKDLRLAERFEITTWPRLLVSRDGKPSYYSFIAPKDMRDFRKILSWMKTVWLPIVPELTASNAKEIMGNSLVVLGILSRERSDEFVIAKREIKNAALEWIDKVSHQRKLDRQELRDAKQLRIEEAEDRGDKRALSRARNMRIVLEEGRDVRFAWVDGVFWERWIRSTFGIDVAKDGERVIIVDEDNHLYWDTTITGNPIVPSRTSILETVPKVRSNPPKIASKSTKSAIGAFFFRIRSTWSHHPILSFLFLSVFAIITYLFTRKLRRRQWGSGGFFNLDGEKGAFGSGMGKVD